MIRSRLEIEVSVIKTGNRSICYKKKKKWIDNRVFSINNILKENGAFMTFSQFKERYEINTDYITYIGCVQAIKSYILKTGLTIDNNMSNHMMKALKVIYSGQKGARLYYEMLIQDANKSKCCEKWETKLNTDINWNTGFKKNTKKFREIKLKWFQIGLVQRMFSNKCCISTHEC